MPIKKFKPTTPSRRHMSVLDRTELTKGLSIPNNLLHARQSHSGRNNQGRITMRNKGNRVKRFYRKVDFKRIKENIPAKVEGIVYDPYRTCHLALISYKDGEKALILAPMGLTKGSEVISSPDADIKIGNAKKLNDIPVGTLVHNVEIHPGSGGQLSRSAGCFVQLMAKEGDFALLRLPSGEVRKVKLNCRATIGQLGNLDNENVSIGKAGRNRHLGKRPKVRGVVMNPVDHPHGGGEGRTSGGRHPCSPWGLLTKGLKTRKNKRTDKFIVKRRKRRKK